MAVTRVVTLVNGIQTEVVPATTSAGAATAGQVVALNANGLVDPTMHPTATASTLGVVVPDGTTITVNGSGVISAVGGGSSGPSMIVPRNRAWQIAVTNASNSTFNVLGMYSFFPTAGNFGFNGFPDAAGYVSGSCSTGTTVNAQVGFCGTKDLIFLNASFRAIYGLTSTASVNCFAGVSSYVAPNLVGGSDPASGAVSFVGFRYFSGLDGTTWHACIGNGSVSTFFDTGVAVNTTQLQMLDMIYVSGLPQFFIDGVRVASSISTVNTPASSAHCGAVAVHQNTAAVSVQANLYQLYCGCG
jgi:hypothetical protein